MDKFCNFCGYNFSNGESYIEVISYNHKIQDVISKEIYCDIDCLINNHIENINVTINDIKYKPLI